VPVKIILLKLFKGSPTQWVPGDAVILLAVAVTFGCSVISYHLIEEKFLYFKDNLEKKFLPR